MPEIIWKIIEGDGPLVATAIHDGHAVRPDVLAHMKLDEAGRLREEDPFTARWTSVAPTQITGLRSRFEVDLNRPSEKAVYRQPEDAWGLQVWQGELPDAIADASLANYDAFYAEVHRVLSAIAATYGRFVVYDLHTYNHRREGPGGPIADPELNPEINVGTGTLNRDRWGHIIDRFITDARAFDFAGRSLDTRENVKFKGGQFGRWIHEQFPETGCALSIEFKKFFMDEWSGEPDPAQVQLIADLLASTVPGVLDELQKR